MADMAIGSDRVSLSHDELDGALTIVTASSVYHDNEVVRLEALRTAFRNLVCRLYYHQKEVKPDGSVYCSDRRTHNIVVAVVEGENGINEGGSGPLSQAECIYVALYTSPEVCVCHTSESWKIATTFANSLPTYEICAVAQHS